MFVKSDYTNFKKARNAATLSTFYKAQIGCIAVYHGEVIGVGFNSEKTHPMQLHYNRYRNKEEHVPFMPKLHAEISCLNSIKHLDINFSKVKIYVYRKRHDCPFSLARPCPSCMAALKDLGIKNIYYTTNYGYAYEKLGKGVVQSA